MITFDFETKPIEGNTSLYPPIPVGLAVKIGGKKSKYYAFGHPSANNSTFEEVKRILVKFWEPDKLFHNSKFDVSVAIHHFGLPMPEPLSIYDTMYALFLEDPYSDTLSLKPSAEKYLGLPPTERDSLADWIMKNTDCPSD